MLKKNPVLFIHMVLIPKTTKKIDFRSIDVKNIYNKVNTKNSKM